MKVLIRSDSSSKIGYGHIKRDLILAKQYEDVSFACLDLQGSLIDEIPYPTFVLENESMTCLVELILEEKFDFFINDCYSLSYEDERYIKQVTKAKILSFDDEIKPHYCDILLNVNAYAKAQFYKDLVPKDCELRCGFAYALVGDEFYEEARLVREKIYDHFICLGGTDVKNLSAQIADKLPKDEKIFIATSSANLNLSSLQEFVHKRSNIALGVDIKNIAKLMNESKKLIITASSLVNEALILKAKFKAICVAKNQEKLAHWLKMQGREVEFYED
ncbi:UDP-2,4-diacetamido-2,4,6-trideoxy-beta-L-altropyranose hydrolase [Campylobacter sp. MIT 99-7217]|uniref:UDP-2,4-diacetamido-2,4, 6-trideoxy-beta-L-altropyranose hydrolase n=1 Tax=Campylobacter sp. MIT 99-7217 TaxID=535091 RepID=UPI00115BC381|nr:UDP-2,4-diacetamido-2,4,6-trideoxy-beta-L-altropyranose hydrolase [Campylobacter sp. MIT 99-7217]TQR33825.1 UDP-2,4-diacetamido-2,4,6-trideoxy-beta-L-altropyranose hydrolase [Campylobacter sp. MIT 99-7217]